MGILEKHSSEIMILILAGMVVATLLVLVPQLLRAHRANQDQRYAERIKSLERGMAPPPVDDRARAAGRTATLVPMVTVCAAATVTCFLVAFRSEHLLAVSIAVWAVAGLVCLAAITGGVALLGRLQQSEGGDEPSPSGKPPQQHIS